MRRDKTLRHIAVKSGTERNADDHPHPDPRRIHPRPQESDTVLTDIARTLAPDGGARNAENRIGRNLMRKGPDSQRPRIGQTNCNVQEFVAFNLPTVAFTLSIDQNLFLQVESRGRRERS